jgi:hypothetical protein
VEGNGAMCDFASAKDTPWYNKSGRVKSVEIGDGVTVIGTYAFYDCAITEAVLPASVATVNENAFAESTKLYAYGQPTAKGKVMVYTYSESQPTQSGLYWHRDADGSIAVMEETNKVTKVLFIGNSFTYYSDIPSLFGSIATAAGKNVVVESVTCGAWTLTKFADPTDEYGKQVAEKLNSNSDYDVIILQEQSTRPLNNYNAFLSAAQSLQQTINQTQTNCQIYLYATWGYEEAATSRNQTIPAMEADLRAAYQNAANTMKVKVCNVGKAFTAMYNQYPQMLTAGTTDSTFNIYYSDNKHPSYIGAFLSACVHVATILNVDPRLSTYTGSLSISDADVLKQTAYTAVFGG